MQGSDWQQSDVIGKLAGVAENTKDKKLQQLVSQIGINTLQAEYLGGFDEKAKNILDYISEQQKKSIILDVGQAKGIAENAKNKLLGPGKMATLRETPDGLRVTQLAIGDNLVAAKPSEISYGGDAARGFQRASNISAQQNVGQASMQGPSEIRVFMQVDGNTLTEVVLDNDLIRKATQRKNGRTTLADGTVIDSGLGRIQGSSLT